MSRISFHGGHSGEFCDHARDTKAAIAEAYCEKGFTHAALIEHLPPDEDLFLYDDERALGHSSRFLRERFAPLFTEVRDSLYRKYSSRIQLMVGFETEFYGARPLARLEEAVEQYRPDIIVASVHHVNDIPIDYSVELFAEAVRRTGGLDNLRRRYYEQQFELLQFLSRYQGQFPVVVGHMDLIKLFSPANVCSEEVWGLIQRNIDYAIAHGMVFEVNARAFKKGLREPYPGGAILSEIASRGGSITLGDDSHAVEEIALHYEKMLSVVRPFFSEATAFERSEEGYLEVQLSV